MIYSWHYPNIFGDYYSSILFSQRYDVDAYRDRLTGVFPIVDGIPIIQTIDDLGDLVYDRLDLVGQQGNQFDNDEEELEDSDSDMDVDEMEQDELVNNRFDIGLPIGPITLLQHHNESENDTQSSYVTIPVSIPYTHESFLA